MVAYCFKDGPLIIKNAKKADAQQIGDALATITQKNNGHLTPRAVVGAARNNRSPLHRFFDWDDAIAAEKFRLEQARDLIQHIKIVDDARPEPAPAFISITQRGGTSYRTLADVQGSTELQLAALQAAERDLRSSERRYQMFADICTIIRAAREQVERRRINMESRGQAQA